MNRSARTDRNGRYTVTFPGGDGDYFVNVAAVGYAPRRFEVKRLADEDFLTADAALERTVAHLDTVRVTGRGRVSRRDANAPDISGTERPVDNSTVDPRQQGDLAAMAATVPGAMPVPGADGDPAGYSVLGLSADQNQVTLNGLPTGASALPRDAGAVASLVTSPFDVSTGGFSGARQALRPRPGTNYVVRSASLNGTAPQVQWSDATARALGQQSTHVSPGGVFSGPLVADKAFYNISYQVSRTENPLRTLLHPDPAALSATGLASDSVRRLAGVLAALRVPTTVPGLGERRTNQQGSLFGSFDLTPPSSASGQALNLTVNGQWGRQTPASSLLAEFPAHTGERTTWNAGVQGRHSGYVRNLFLSETTLGSYATHSAGTPYLELPSGSVLVTSTFADRSGSVRQVFFGGSATMRTAQRTSSVGAMNQLSWFSRNNKHRLKLATELRREFVAQDETADRFGTFTYASLADLATGVPALYTRQLSPRLRRWSQAEAAVSLGDSYRRTPRLQFQYGLRVDANRFATAPAENPDVQRVFGTPNTTTPSRAYLSPRFGFSWAYGTAPQLSAFQGAVRGPRAVVRGGVGIFQDVPQATVLGTAVSNSGLPDATGQLTCVGSAAPTPNWAAYVADPTRVPDRCADGTIGTSFANASPHVTLFARDWRAPRRLSSSLQWSGPVLGNRLSATVEGVLSRNAHQPGSVDLNFAGVRRFALADEGNRPVYVDVSAVMPATGVVALQGARVSSLFARVAEQRSDLRSTSRQVQVSVAPTAFNPGFRWSLAYVYTDVREQSSGFASTAGDPRGVEWALGTYAPRHQVQYTLSYNVRNMVTLTWWGNVRSGVPYTPQIGSDVNGDGYANDRAFVFDPARAADPALAAGMRRLLAGGAATCLRRQLGAIAGRNSCEGSWSQTANVFATLNPLKVRLPQRINLTFALSNPLGAIDRALHGGAGLRGWGQAAFPDPALLYARGFDAQGPTGPHFRYEVNPRFGATRPQLSAFRQPAVLTAQLRLDLGPARERQALVQGLDLGRRRAGERMPESLLKSLYGTGGVPNPMAQLLRQADTLRLTAVQADSIATINRWYVVRLDSIWSPLAKQFAALPADYSHAAAYDRYRAARRASVDLLLRLVPAINGVLTAQQRRRLPLYVASALDVRYLAAVRSGTAGVGGAGGFSGTAGGTGR